jgi:hypothetical protein
MRWKNQAVGFSAEYLWDSWALASAMRSFYIFDEASAVPDSIWLVERLVVDVLGGDPVEAETATCGTR